MLSEAKNLSDLDTGEQTREILRFAQNDKLVFFFAAGSARLRLISVSQRSKDESRRRRTQ
jgi:hypothetical protein